MNATEILWSTRGKDWGFRLLRTPSFNCEDWLDFHQSVFGGSESDEHFFCKRTSEFRGVGLQRYAALRFADPEMRKDSANRVIPHEVIVFGELSETISDWGSGKAVVWPLLSDFYANHYGKSPASIDASMRDSATDVHTNEDEPTVTRKGSEGGLGRSGISPGLVGIIALAAAAGGFGLSRVTTPAGIASNTQRPSASVVRLQEQLLNARQAADPPNSSDELLSLLKKGDPSLSESDFVAALFDLAVLSAGSSPKASD